MANELVPVVTPVGELHYVQISGQGKLNYNEDGYNYVATVNLTGEKAEHLKAKINEVLGEVGKGENVKSLGYREILEDEEGRYTPTQNTKDRDANAKPTGIFAFTFSTAVAFSDGKPKKISVYNSSTPPVKINLGDKKIGNGSTGALSGKMQRFKKGKDVGVSLFLNAVQLVNFIEYVGDAGFDGQEGGWTGNDEEMDTGEDAPAAATTSAPAKTEAAKPKL